MRLPARTLRLGDAPASWEALGFQVDGGRMELGGLDVELTGVGGGILGLEVEGLAADGPAGLPIHRPAGDGPPVSASPGRASRDAGAGSVGALAVDHLVVLAGAFGETVDALSAAGLDLRPRREGPASPVRQAFFNLATTILEVGEREGPARFWGMTIVVADLDAAAERLGPLLGTPRAAVQPGRRIATVRRDAGLGLAVALMTPRVRTR